MGKTVVILGGGVGGLVAARRLRQRLSREHRVVLVDRTGHHVFWPSLLWVMTGDRSSDGVVRDLSVLKRKGIEVRRAAVTAIDPSRRVARLGEDEIQADYLILALGADLTPERIPGLAQGAHECFSVEGATRTSDALRQQRGGRIAVVVSSMPYKCPGAPIEAALLLDAYFRRRRIPAEVALYTPEPVPLPVIGGEVSEAVLELLRARGIPYHAQRQLESVQPEARRLRFAGGETAEYDFLLAVPPIAVPRVVRESGLLGNGGWVPVDRAALTTPYERVYAVGDLVGIPLAHGKPLPKAGVFAHHQAETVAANIAAEIAGERGRAAFDGWGQCFIETGNPRAGFGSGNFYAEPSPQVTLRPPARRWHWAKVLWERYWLRRWF